ncbi:hypothetical protein PF005_g3039 [Phytophthora fragariae]|uniref:Uncharacterized protein n=1 Tax=Phytophthora fragariae TaxID=53985 RepID=A0A6A4ENX8_9STRA|nr:hypothetical protein PF003_g35671 [Phytophthora fragariae]KAE8947096.1 hypothetical protein PF009_g3290 [Phytophthora fragariae]KAE9026576.1 hypothetical protein PF011_g2466 [Phytophthora fragariae]KAE9133720.1 hypothetical protein PF010_g2723 [Phytophthora fragariae]KAE9134387.1 hypothetical protein PF007_g2945 [Phytophthora fragariae]
MCTFTYVAIISSRILTIVPLIVFVPYIQAFNFEYIVVEDPEFIYNPVAHVTMIHGWWGVVTQT